MKRYRLRPGTAAARRGWRWAGSPASITINAGNNLLPSDLPMPPIYSKVNPADAPVLTIAVTSPSLPVIKLHDLTENRLAPKLSQVDGIGLVSLSLIHI